MQIYEAANENVLPFNFLRTTGFLNGSICQSVTANMITCHFIIEHKISCEVVFFRKKMKTVHAFLKVAKLENKGKFE